MGGRPAHRHIQLWRPALTVRLINPLTECRPYVPFYPSLSSYPSIYLLIPSISRKMCLVPPKKFTKFPPMNNVIPIMPYDYTLFLKTSPSANIRPCRRLFVISSKIIPFGTFSQIYTFLLLYPILWTILSCLGIRMSDDHIDSLNKHTGSR